MAQTESAVQILNPALQIKWFIQQKRQMTVRILDFDDMLIEMHAGREQMHCCRLRTDADFGFLFASGWKGTCQALVLTIAGAPQPSARRTASLPKMQP
jgi:hypothetical protein